MMENMLMIIVGAVAGGLLILMLVIVITITCHHKRKNEKLEKELTEKRYAELAWLLIKIKMIWRRNDPPLGEIKSISVNKNGTNWGY